MTFGSSVWEPLSVGSRTPHSLHSSFRKPHFLVYFQRGLLGRDLLSTRSTLNGGLVPLQPNLLSK